MANKRLYSDLSVKGINNLVKKLETYKSQLNDKNEVFVKRLAEIGLPVIDSRISLAEGDSDKNHYAYIKINRFEDYSEARLIVEGKDLLFIEFGAGIHYNTAAGTSPHPKGEELGYTIGSYGKGHGSQDHWYYTDEDGTRKTSYGTQATMPVYSAYAEIRRKIITIAKEVFGG